MFTFALRYDLIRNKSNNMDNCLNCGAELTHFEGRKKKVFCGDNCRVKFNRKKDKPEMVTIPKVEYDKMKLALLGVLRTEKGITVVNPDNGGIVQHKPNPIKQKKDLSELYPHREEVKPKEDSSFDPEFELMQKIATCKTISDAESVQSEIARNKFLLKGQRAMLHNFLKEQTKEFYND